MKKELEQLRAEVVRKTPAPVSYAEKVKLPNNNVNVKAKEQVFLVYPEQVSSDEKKDSENTKKSIKALFTQRNMESKQNFEVYVKVVLQ